MISQGPLLSKIPFVTVESVVVSTNDTGDTNLSVKVSNDTLVVPRTKMQFGNCFYFTNSEEELMTVANDLEAIHGLLKSSPRELKFNYMVGQRDFGKKQTSRQGSRKQTIYSYARTNQFVLPASSELYVLVISYTDYRNKLRIGNISKQTILKSNAVPNRAKLYLLDETVPRYGEKGSIWPGQVHEHEGVLMAGARHVLEKHPRVREEVVVNTKIKDARAVSLINAMVIGAPPPPSTRDFFSPLKVSRNNQGPANGLFSFDYYKFVRQNIALKGILENKDSVLSSVQISDVEIYSKLVGADVKGNALTPYRPLGCGLSATQTVKRVATIGNNCDILDTPNNGNDILDISFSDNTVQKLIDNVVQYEAVVTISDNSTIYLRNLMTELANSIRIANLGIKTGRNTMGTRVYSTVVDQYLAAVEYIKGAAAFKPFDVTYWRKNLLALMYNSDKDISLTVMVLQAIEGFVSKVNKLITPVGGATSEVSDYSSKIARTKKTSELRIENTFEEKLYIKGPANYGVSVTDEVADYSRAMPTITYTRFDQRTQQETSKYQISNPNSTNLNRFGFLSPSYIGLGVKKEVNTKSTTIDADSLVTMARSNLSRGRVPDNKKMNDDLSEKLEVMALAGVAIEPLKVSLKKLVITPETVQQRTTSARDILSRNSKFAIVDTKNQTTVQTRRAASDPEGTGSVISSFVGADGPGTNKSILRSRRSVNPSSTPVINSVVSSVVSNFAPIGKITNSPLIESSPMLEKAKTDEASVQDSNSLTNMVNYGLISEVQYLEPYDEKQGVKKQNWKRLDSTTFENAKKANRPLVCRTQKISNTIELSPDINIETMGSVFIIGESKRKTVIASAPTIERDDKLVEQIININNDLVYSSDTSPLPAVEMRKEDMKEDTPALRPARRNRGIIY